MASTITVYKNILNWTWKTMRKELQQRMGALFAQLGDTGRAFNRAARDVEAEAKRAGDVFEDVGDAVSKGAKDLGKKLGLGGLGADPINGGPFRLRRR